MLDSPLSHDGPLRIAILANQPNASCDALRRVADARCHLEFVAWRDMEAMLGERETAGPFGRRFDGVLVRGMPAGSLEQVIFQMNILGRLEALGTVVVNPARSLEIAIDKFLSLALLGAAGLPVPLSAACQTVEQGMDAFQRLGSDVVVKPVFGGEGRGMIRVSDADMAARCFQAIVTTGGILYLQEYLDHGNADLRLLGIGDAFFGMKRVNPSDWRTNAARGGVCSHHEASKDELDLARKAIDVVGCDYAGVDLVRTVDQRLFVIEVNAIPGWQKTESCCGQSIAAALLNLVAHRVNTRRRAVVPQ